MGSLSLFGAPPEKYWGYTEGIDQSPPAFCYSFASNYQALSYFRADTKNANTNTKDGSLPAPAAQVDALTSIKETIARGLPFMFGFTVYDSIRSAVGGKIPFPSAGEKVLGGHAILAVGYYDGMKIGSGNLETTGAFLIRNSWGVGWGEAGYGWLPYEYLLSGIAQDWWCLVKAEWVDVSQFGV